MSTDAALSARPEMTVAMVPAVTATRDLKPRQNAEPETLYRLLERYRITPEQFLARHPGTLFMIARLFGACPEVVTTYGMYPVCLSGYVVMIGGMLDVPNCDAGKGPISIELRRQICVVSAMVIQCAYCSAVYCGLGSAFDGGILSKPNAPRLKMLPTDLSDSAKAVLKMVVAAVKVPARVTKEIRANIVNHLGEEGLVVACQMMSTIGYSTTLADLLGVELDSPYADLATHELSSSGWEPMRHDGKQKSSHHDYAFSDPERYKDLHMGESCFTSCIGSNSFTKTIDLMINSKKADAEHLPLLKASGVPAKDVQAQDAWLREQMGYVPRFLARIKSPMAKLSLYFNLHAALFIGSEVETIPDLQPSLPINIKLLCAFVFYTAVDNAYMACGMAAHAKRRGIDADALLQAVDIAANFSRMGPNGEETSRSEYLARKPATRTLETQLVMIAWLSARRQRIYLYPLMEDLVILLDERTVGRTCVEIACLMGVLTLLQRLSVGLDDELGLEPEVNEVAHSEFGRMLGLDKCGSTASCVSYSGVTSLGGLSRQGREALQTKAAEKTSETVWSGDVSY
ncbi:hypothetical protein HK101_011370 [Irineochytrium annulatum]|nr:hypothetical protein HK101_011370 [Irineochytrium annulatum]